MKRIKIFILTAILLFPAAAGYGQEIPVHPDKLVFPDLVFNPPDPANYRTTLSNGMVAYIAEDRELPLINIAVYIRGGSAWEPAEKTGLASLTGTMLRDGGTMSRQPHDLDEEIDFLAANLSTMFGNTSGFAALNVLSYEIEKGLDLLVDILRNPRFDEERFRIQRERIRQNLARRNDRTSEIEAREWRYLMFGEDHFSARNISVESLNSIERDDMIDFHSRFVHPGNMILAVSGDFEKDEIVVLLENAFMGWEPMPAWDEPVPAPEHEPVPGIYLIDKPDVNQGRVSLGHLGITEDNPDKYAVEVMNGILGASGFTSRIMSRVRSDEGLAYSAGSSFGIGLYYPETFRAFFQSRNEACAYAVKIVIEEIKRIRNDSVGDDELLTQKNYMLEAFPRRFASPRQTVELYARDEFLGYEPERWLSYRDIIREITADDLLRVAGKYLDPDNLVILAVGRVDDMLKGDPAYDASFEDPGDLPISRLPLRDPLTLRFE